MAPFPWQSFPMYFWLPYWTFLNTFTKTPEYRIEQKYSNGTSIFHFQFLVRWNRISLCWENNASWSDQWLQYGMRKITSNIWLLIYQIILNFYRASIERIKMSCNILHLRKSTMLALYGLISIIWMPYSLGNENPESAPTKRLDSFSDAICMLACFSVKNVFAFGSN